MKAGTPVIVVSGSNDPTEPFNTMQSLNSSGFDIIGEVTIPPADFSLPDSGKKKNENIEASDRPTKRKSNCVVTVAIAPKQ